MPSHHGASGGAVQMDQGSMINGGVEAGAGDGNGGKLF